MESSYINSYRNALVSESLHEMNETINKALESLPENYQQVITLHYFNNMDSVQIAKFLCISPEAVRQRLARARSELKEGVLNMMSAVFEEQKRQRLHAIFTFRIVEAIKRIRMEPALPLKGLPWGLSLTTGLIMAIIGICTNININLSNENYQSISSVASEAKVLNVGEFPVDVMNVADISVMANANSNGNGSGNIELDLQNALFMAPQAEGGTWTKKADMLSIKEGFGCSTVDNKIYTVGGGGGDGGPTAKVEEYDPLANKWVSKSDMPTARMYLSSSVVDGKIYAIGGMIFAGADVALPTVEEYDPQIEDKGIEFKGKLPTTWGNTKLAQSK